MRRYTEILAVLALSAGMALHAQTNEMVIQTRKLGAEIQPTMYGLFFEDINYAADGGLYAELVKNRSFEFPQHLRGCVKSKNQVFFDILYKKDFISLLC